MRSSVALVFVAVLMVGLLGCGSETTVVESGTYEGTIQEINAEESEIYVSVPDRGTLELYFKESTRLVRDGQSVEFSELAVGQKVRVQVKRVGKRLDPVRVEILE